MNRYPPQGGFITGEACRLCYIYGLCTYNILYIHGADPSTNSASGDKVLHPPSIGTEAGRKGVRGGEEEGRKLIDFTRGRKNREYLATFPSELHCVRMHSSVANSWKDLPVNFTTLLRVFNSHMFNATEVQLWKWFLRVNFLLFMRHDSFRPQ
jgi:hypothetical protein